MIDHCNSKIGQVAPYDKARNSSIEFEPQISSTSDFSLQTTA